MKIQLLSPALQFTFHQQEGTWTLLAPRPNLGLEAVRSSVYWNGARTLAIQYQVSEPTVVETCHGPAQSLTVTCRPERNSVLQRLTFTLPAGLPALLVQMEIENQGQAPLFLDRFDFLQVGPTAPRAARPARLTGLLPDGFFSNGWQSWNYTGAYGPQDHFQRTRLGCMTRPMRDNPGTPHPRGRGEFGSDMFGAIYDRQTRQGWLAGFLGQQQGFGSLYARLRGEQSSLALWSNGDGARLDPQQRYTTDWAYLQPFSLDDSEPLATYLEAVARQHGLQPDRWGSSPTGWSSWYHYYWKLNAADVRANLQAAIQMRPELPLQLIQIDDGFEAAVGDWHAFKPGFPDGLAPLAQEIRQAGFTPGLWLAPFSVQRSARLARQHPEWLLRSKRGRLVNAGYTFNEAFGAALDLTHPEALAYVAGVIDMAVHQWGFSYLKLDFLYAAALSGQYHDPTRTRAQVLRQGLETVRQAAGEGVTLVGCGCPLGPAIGIVDAMRIGADVSERWQPAYFGTEIIFRPEPDLPSVRNSIQNALTRASMHRRWWINDPDALLVRPQTRLSQAEVESLATVLALSGGSLFISDALHELPCERVRLAAALLPPIGQRPRVLDLFDRPTPARLRVDLHNQTGEWHCLACFNWSSRAADLTLHPADFGLDVNQVYIGREFWSGQIIRMEAEGQLFSQTPAHGVVLASVRAVPPDRPAYLGSSLHISQGLEVRDWRARPGVVELWVERPGCASGEIELYLPQPPRQAYLDGKECTWTTGRQGRYRFPLSFSNTAHLVVKTGMV